MIFLSRRLRGVFFLCRFGIVYCISWPVFFFFQKILVCVKHWYTPPSTRVYCSNSAKLLFCLSFKSYLLAKLQNKMETIHEGFNNIINRRNGCYFIIRGWAIFFAIFAFQTQGDTPHPVELWGGNQSKFLSDGGTIDADWYFRADVRHCVAKIPGIGLQEWSTSAARQRKTSYQKSHPSLFFLAEIKV